MPGLCGKRRLVSGCAFRFQHFHHLVGRWKYLMEFSDTLDGEGGASANFAMVFLPLIPTTPHKAKWRRFAKISLYSLQHHASRNRREFMKISSRPPSTDSLRICQTGEGISFYPPLHGIIPTIFENAKNGRKKTGNLFLISCLGMPFCIYGGYSFSFTNIILQKFIHHLYFR